MAYEKQTWHTGDVITQEKLNHMEDGIASMGGLTIINTADFGSWGEDIATYQFPYFYDDGDEEWAQLNVGGIDVEVVRYNNAVSLPATLLTYEEDDSSASQWINNQLNWPLDSYTIQAPADVEYAGIYFTKIPENTMMKLIFFRDIVDYSESRCLLLLPDNSGVEWVYKTSDIH